MKHLILTLFLLASGIVFTQQTKKHGPFEAYYKTGSLKTSGQYREGKKVGKWQDYYESGELSKIYTYTRQGKQTGFQESYYKSGNLKSKTGKSNTGSFIEEGFYGNGALFYVMTLSRRPKSDFLIKNGVYREFFKDKNVKIEANYKKGQLEGTWIKYYNSGQKEWEVNYHSGYKQGAYSKYFKNGQLECEGHTVLELKDGEEKRYNEQGVLILEGQYVADKMHGKWVSYNASGTKTSTVKYIKGIAKKAKNNVEIKPTKIPEGVFEKVPVYPGCELLTNNWSKKKCMSNKIARFVNKKFNTDIASNLGLKGQQKIHIAFKIDKQGEIVDVNSKAPHPLLKFESIRVVKLLPKMKPGSRRGKPSELLFFLPIIFNVQ
jgi:antitoxin component YwqK of YwqJK toxin-antitoxin module